MTQQEFAARATEIIKQAVDAIADKEWVQLKSSLVLGKNAAQVLK